MASTHRRIHHTAANDGWRCVFCGRETECANCVPGTLVQATVDHIVPRAWGGPNNPSNYQIACLRCNHDKGDDIWPARHGLRAERIPTNHADPEPTTQ